MPTHSDSSLAPIWTVGFRPFFLLGALYGPFILLWWLGIFTGLPLSMPHEFGNLITWHQHEMIFGYAMAIIAGFLLTAVPSWVGGDEINGPRLVSLVVAWLAGRAVIWLPLSLPWWLVMVVDQLMLTLLLIYFAPVVWRCANRRFLSLLLILSGFLLGNAYFHIGASVRPDLLPAAMEVSVYSLVLFYSLVGGILTTVFTGNVLRQSGWSGELKLIPWLEYACVVSVLALAMADLFELPSLWVNLSAASALAFHVVRFLRWRSWIVYRYPLVLVLHCSYAWLVVTFALKLVAGLDWLSASAAWVHAFTIGVLGMKQLGLITRVSLRHTGRPLMPSRLMIVAFCCMFAAATVRVLVSIYGLSHEWLTVSAAFWATAFILYVVVNASFLIGSSLNKEEQQAAKVTVKEGFWLLEQGQSGKK